MRKRVAIAIALVTNSSVLHYVVFPEPFPAPSDLPRAGRTLVNEGIRSRFVCRQTSVETAGRLFEWDNFVEPGGGPCEIPHVHPHMREVFQILDGEVAFIINGREQAAGPGSTVVVQPGTTHAFRNATDRPAHMISRVEAVDDGPWAQLAERGLLLDSTFLQINRTGGLGRVSPIQMLVFVSRYKQGYPPGLPTWAWDAIAFVVAPTARIFGVHAYYPLLGSARRLPNSAVERTTGTGSHSLAAAAHRGVRFSEDSQMAVYEAHPASIGAKPSRTTDGPPVRAYAAVKKAGKDWAIL